MKEDRGLPYGLRDSLCTLQPLRSVLTAPPYGCNTRYEWLVRPFSTGTCTQSETPSFPWRTDEMSTKNHNETLVGIHFAIGVFLALGLVVSPWVIGHRERMQAMAIISAVLLPVALLMFSTAFALHRKKPLGRKLALWSVSVLFMVCCCSL